ncbi:MAG: class I SAM-dependent methyltransferase [Acidimicrobiales bacterium]
MTAPRCRSCGEALEVTVVDLGEQPLANSYLEPSRVDDEQRFPLHARLCVACGLVQVDDVVPPEHIFSDYAYFSSYSPSWVEHSRRHAEASIERLHLGAGDLVVEVASNDGYLLQWFVAAGVPVLGIEPAANVAEVARAAGVPTEVAFFGRETAIDVRRRHGPARLVVANNVLAHVPDLNDFIAGLAVVLADDGLVTIEFPHLLNLVRETQFDTIYHEHFSYFSLLAARGALGRHGLEVVDVEELATHGGSLRLHVAHAGTRPVEPAVEALLERERQAALDRPEGFADFARRVEACRASLRELLDTCRDDGRTVVAYGAAAKGNTLLNHAGVGPDDIAYVVDRNPHKQGLLLPGSHLEVRDPAEVDRDRPDLLLVLPWNLLAEITEQMAGIRTWGGRFVTAVPTVVVHP